MLDEADSLLDMGFRDDIEDIITYLPPSPVRQTFLFSATVSKAIQQIAEQTLSENHAFINCERRFDAVAMGDGLCDVAPQRNPVEAPDGS